MITGGCLVTLRLTEHELRALIERRRAPARARPTGRRWEVELDAQLQAAGITVYVREHRFLEDRRFRFDFAFPLQKIAVEVDGVVHRIKKRFNADREKGNLALLGGWRVLHVSPQQVRSGEALKLIQQMLMG